MHEQVTVGGVALDHYLPMPATMTAVPLLVTLHGTMSDACAHAEQSRWLAHPGLSGRDYAIAMPNAPGRLWNHRGGTPDVEYLRAVVADVRGRVAVDQDRIYVGGHSNGAFMAQRTACDAADLFAAAAVYAGGSQSSAWQDDCVPARGIAVGLWHGDRDFVVPDTLGRRSRDAWAAREQCSVRSPATGEAAHVVSGPGATCATRLRQ